MKRKFTLLIAAAVMLLTMIVQPGRAWGQTTHTIGWGTATGGEGTYTNFTATSGTVNGILSFSSNKNGSGTNPAYNSNASELRLYYASSGDGGSITIEPVQGLTITSAVITTSTAPSVKYYVNGGEGVSVSATNNTYTITGITASESLKIQNANTTNTQLRIKTIAITYITGSGTLDPCDLALENDPISLSFDLYNNTNAQVINYTTSSSGTVTIANNSYVETVVDQVNKTITVTPSVVTNGEKTITVNQAADDNYYAGSTTFTVNITDSTPFAGGDVTFDATVDMGTSPIIKNGVTFACTNGALNNGSEYRLYKNSVTTFSVESTSGNSITQIAFTCTANNPASGFATQDGWTTNGDNGTWTGNAQEVSFTASGAQVRATKIVVTVATSGSDPYITASNVDIAYDAAAGEIEYTVNNPASGGVLTATTESDWLILGTVGATVPFTCGVNPAATERAATVTLTYTYDAKATVTKDVTVTQAGNPDVYMTISEVRAQGTGSVTTKGFVTSCVGTTGYIQDNDAAICVYGSSLTVGDEIRVSGSLTTYNGLLEITSPQVTVVSSGNVVDPEVMTVAEVVESTNQGWYIRIENATVTAISGQNTTIAQGESTIVVRGISGVTLAVNDIISLNGNIGCFNANQIANPQDVTVQQPTEPTITLSSYAINAPIGGANGTLTVTYENITDVAADVWFCDAAGENETTYDWVTAEINTDNNLYYLVEENDGAARTAYFKVWAYDDDMNEVYSDLVTISQDEYVAPTYATLPFEFDGGRANIAETDGLYEEGLGDDYGSSPKLRFDNTGDWLLLQFNERPGTLTFDIKGNSFSGSTFKLQTSEDGVSYTDLKTYTELGSTQSESFNNLDINVRYIKWIFTEKVSGNVALGNIALAAYDYTPSITLESYSIDVDAKEYDGTINVTYKNVDVASADIYFCDSEGEPTSYSDWIQVDIDNEDNVYYVIEANTGDARIAYFKVYSMDDETNLVYSELVTVTQAAPLVAHSISIDPNIEHGSIEPNVTSAVEGTEISLTVTHAPGYVIESLTVTEATSSMDVPTVEEGGNYSFSMPNDDVFVTATFVETTEVTYTLVTSIDDLTPGYHYLIASAPTLDKLNIMDEQKNNNRGVKTVDVDNNTITLTTLDNYYDFVISGDANNGWTIYDEQKPGYLYASSSSSNQLKTRDANSDGNSVWNIEFDNGNLSIVAKGGNTRNTMQYNSGSSIFACYSSASQSAVYLYKKVGDTNPVYYSPTEIAVANPDPTSEPIIVVNNEILVLTGNLDKCNNPDNLIVEDGGQLVFSGTGVQATMKKSTAHANTGSKDAADWYTIASPLAANVATNAVGNLTNGTYDLYRYNEAAVMWENAKDTEHSGGFNELTVGRGYLYWNESGSDITFAGELRNADVAYTLKADGAGNYKGFNLIGNPFSQNITMSNITGVTLSGGYVLTQAGGWGASIDEIAPCQGFLVQVEAETDITITKPTSSSKSRTNRDYLAFTVANAEYEDVAYAMFEEATGLSKINHRNADIPMVYIPQNGQNYAIATMDDNTQAFELNFKAMTTGQYTLSYKAEGKYSYLHVIDRLTGEDIDMLLDGEYSFIGSPRDNEARFIVKLSYNANIDEIEVNDNFAYQNGSDIIVNGNGELQVFDVTGRMVMNTKINGIQTVNVPATGMYIFRMVGESVQTQKIVVR